MAEKRAIAGADLEGAVSLGEEREVLRKIVRIRPRRCVRFRTAIVRRVLVSLVQGVAVGRWAREEQAALRTTEEAKVHVLGKFSRRKRERVERRVVVVGLAN